MRPAVLLIDGEWLLPRRPPSGAWEFDRSQDLEVRVESLVAAALAEAEVRRTLCFRNWSDPSVANAPAITSALQRRLIELHHVPTAPAGDDPTWRGYQAANRTRVNAAIRGTIAAELLGDTDRVVVTVGVDGATLSGLAADRIIRLALPEPPPLWRETLT
jgi:hypothetical protein